MKTTAKTKIKATATLVEPVVKKKPSPKKKKINDDSFDASVLFGKKGKKIIQQIIDDGEPAHTVVEVSPEDYPVEDYHISDPTKMPEPVAVEVLPDSNQPKKRGRGRPPGAKNKIQKPKPEVDPNAPKKKRGRPPGAKNKIQKPKPEVDPNAPKRGRGRPPGSKNKIQKPKPEVDPNAPKRKRGRPAGSGVKKQKNVFMPTLEKIEVAPGNETAYHVTVPVLVTENKIKRVDGYVCVICSNKKQVTAIEQKVKVGRNVDMHPSSYMVDVKNIKNYAQPYCMIGTQTGANWVYVSYDDVVNKDQTFATLFKQNFPAVDVDSNWTALIKNDEN
ncbi:hypothetical protein [Microcystis phage Mel-JY01]